MEQITNDQTLKECSSVLGHQVENIPQLDTSKVLLTADVNPKTLRTTTILKSSAITGTLYTTPTNQDFYLTDVNLCVANKVASQDSSASIAVTPKGGASTIISGVNFSTSALLDVNSESMVVHLENPILLERNTNITASATNCASSRFVAMGYIVDTL